MDRREASTKGISKACIAAVDQFARCTQDATDVIDQCKGMSAYLAPAIVEKVTARYYLKRACDAAHTLVV